MKLSGGYILSGKVVEIEEGLEMTRVTVDIGGDEVITVIVTDAALKELDAKVGDEMEVLLNTGVTAGRVLH